MTENAFEAIRQKFLARCRTDLEAVRSLAAGIPATDEIRTLIHRLSGIAGSLGYANLSQYAAQVDDSLKRDVPASDAELERLEVELTRVAAEN